MPRNLALPRVSVIIPAYNVQNYLAQSVRSVLAQTFADFELLIVNDGSTDRTLEVAAGFDDPRIRVITQLNRGLAGARNCGIRAARGEYLAFLDADDLWRADKLEQHVRHLDARAQVGVSYSQSEFIAEDGSPLNYGQYPKLRDISPRDVFLRNPIGNGSAPVIRAVVMRQIMFRCERAGHWGRQFFDETFRRSEDIECWMRIALRTAWKFEGIGQPLTLYRVNAGGLSANLEAQLQAWETMVVKLRRYAPHFIERHANEARGYQLRYLARRAVRSGKCGAALRLVLRGLLCHPRMLREEPARTLMTAAAASLGMLMPHRAYLAVEGLSMSVAQGWRQHHVGALATPSSAT